MNAAEITLLICALILGIYMVWRAFCLRNMRADEGFFPSFWIWPLLYLGLLNLVPGWSVRQMLFDGIRGLLLLGGVLDFFYCYGFKREKDRRWQLMSLWLLLPFLVFINRFALPAHRTSLVLPHHGKALVWTEGIWEPQTFYFVRTDDESKASAEEVDPNFGRPVFAPLTGMVAAIEDNHLILVNDHIRIALGPFIEKSLRVAPGHRVVAHQPLGLLGASDATPGIRMAILDGNRVAFKDVLAGRVMARELETTVPQRNDYVTSNAAKRWRLE